MSEKLLQTSNCDDLVANGKYLHDKENRNCLLWTQMFPTEPVTGKQWYQGKGGYALSGKRWCSSACQTHDRQVVGQSTPDWVAAWFHVKFKSTAELSSIDFTGAENQNWSHSSLAG
jgi:hypothetical protein